MLKYITLRYENFTAKLLVNEKNYFRVSTVFGPELFPSDPAFQKTTDRIKLYRIFFFN
jgi:hypothetical protein